MRQYTTRLVQITRETRQWTVMEHRETDGETVFVTPCQTTLAEASAAEAICRRVCELLNRAYEAGSRDKATEIRRALGV